MDPIAKQHGLEAALPTIRRYSRAAVAFSLENRSGRSRFGGAPLLPPGFTWPSYVPHPVELPAALREHLGMSDPVKPTEPEPLDLLLQVDLADLAQFEVAGPLPRSGLLTFFYDMQHQPWGYDPKTVGGFRVVFVEDRSLVETPPPRPPPFSARGLEFWSSITVPHPGSHAYDCLDAEISGGDRYFEFCSELERSHYPENRGLHRIFGHSANVQGDMQLEAQLVSHGIYCGDPSGYDDPRVPELKQGAEDWVMLLQLDSDDSVDMMWGDFGMLYYWIREDDLRGHPLPTLSSSPPVSLTISTMGFEPLGSERLMGSFVAKA
jgi:uncharacterized protein YwqG